MVSQLILITFCFFGGFLWWRPLADDFDEKLDHSGRVGLNRSSEKVLRESWLDLIVILVIECELEQFLQCWLG